MAPPLLPILRSPLQAALLAQTFLTPDHERSLTELAERTGGSLATTQREVDRLEVAGILRSRRVGPTRLVAVDKTSPLFEALSQLVLVALGPPAVVAEELGAIDRIDQAFIFGSWAARYLGAVGPSPADVDVLVIGQPDRDAVHDAALSAEHRLGLPVNATVRSAANWKRNADGFIQQVKSQPLVPIPIILKG